MRIPSVSGGRPLAFLGAVLGALLLVVSALVGAGQAQAAPGDKVDLEYSADGVTWGGPEQIPWDRTTIPVPGGSPNTTTVHVRAARDVPVDGEVYLGAWSISEGTAWFQVDVDDVAGKPVTLSAPGTEDEWGVLMAEFSLDAGESAKLALKVGVPADETAQSATIAPAWTPQLTEAEPAVVDPDPEPEPEPGQGSIDLGSLNPDDFGSLGSAGSVGSLGSLSNQGGGDDTQDSGSAGSAAGSSALRNAVVGSLESIGSSEVFGSSVKDLPTGSNFGSGYWLNVEPIYAPAVLTAG